MKALLIVLIVLACLTCIVAMAMLVRELLETVFAKKEDAPAPVVSSASVVEEKKPAPEVMETAVALDSENAVTFESTAKLTLDEKYAMLDEKSKRYYDEIIAYAETKEGVRCFKNARYVEYKSGKNRLVRVNVKRGVVISEFILPNNDFKNYVSGNKLAIKLPTTVIKVTDDVMLSAVKESIDVAAKVIAEEKEMKRLANLEKRRLARQAKEDK